jgi:23S rRNA pseudouridine2605 synthase
MPRDNDKHKDSRGRREGPPGRKGRSGVPRGPQKKFAKRGFAGEPRSRGEGHEPRQTYRARRDWDGEKKTDAPRSDRTSLYRDDRSLHRQPRDAKFGDKRRSFGERPDRGDARPQRGHKPPDREEGRRFDRDDRSPHHRPRDAKFDDKRRSFGERPDRGDARPQRGHKPPDRDEGGRFGKPKSEKNRFDKPRERPKAGSDWQEHPRSERQAFHRDAEHPRRDHADERKVFAKRPPFGGRGAWRERAPEEVRSKPAPRKKTSERIAKVMSRAGLASRRDAEDWIVQGRVTVNGRIINSPALNVTANDVITVDGKPLPPRERTRLFLYHKPRGLMTTHADPEGRPTVFDNLPEGLPRLISVGRLDFNTEGLLLLTNDGGLARALELPDTGWLRRYRVRAHGEVTQAQLDALKNGIEIDGVKYGPIDATLERDSGANVWLVFAIREGKNREVRNVMAHLGLEVNRLIRVSYGPFQLADLGEGAIEEVKTRVLREQLGEKIAVAAGADFDRPIHGQAAAADEDEVASPLGNEPPRLRSKGGLIADRKGRRVLVQRTGSEEARARNEAEASGYGPPRRPRRGYHGKRDLKPRDE